MDRILGLQSGNASDLEALSFQPHLLINGHQDNVGLIEEGRKVYPWASWIDWLLAHFGKRVRRSCYLNLTCCRSLEYAPTHFISRLSEVGFRPRHLSLDICYPSACVPIYNG